MNPLASLNLVDVIYNRHGLYRGDLVHYFRIIMRHARNLRNPYHNFRHGFHVLWLCHEALRFYYDEAHGHERARALLIAAMFHDYDHTGRTGNDDLNIELALRGVTKHIVEDDRHLLPRIIQLIKSTEYPFVVDARDLSIEGQILRDADASQALSPAWIQQVIFGLAGEMNVDPLDVFKMQPVFLGNLTFCTDWARATFTQAMILDKINEAQGFLNLLTKD